MVLIGPYHSKKDRIIIENMLKQMPLKKNIIINGPVFGLEKWQAMNKFDIFTHTSRFEGVPNSVLEAMACELPVTLSDIPSHRELVKDKITGFLVNPEDAFSVIEDLRLIDMNPVQATEMGKKARELVEQEFSWSATASGYLSLLNTEQ